MRYEFVDNTLAKLNEAAQNQVNGTGISLEKLMGLKDFKWKTFSEAIGIDWIKGITEERVNLFLTVSYLIKLKKYYGITNQTRNIEETMPYVFSDVHNLIGSGLVENDLFVDTIDALLYFTDVSVKGPKTHVHEKEYENYWHWALAMSINGGNKAIDLLAKELGSKGTGKRAIGNEIFSTKKDWNYHWSVAYQEIVLEAIYLARTPSEGSRDLKIHTLETCKKYKSPHVKRLSQVMVSNEVDCSERHSVRDHRILLLYIQERLKHRTNDYTKAVLADKLSLIEKVTKITNLPDPKK